MSRHKITVTFEVIDDDMPSERRLKYRQAMIDAMTAYQGSVGDDIAELGKENIDPDTILNVELIDKMLGDCYK
jgi:hypothetical protein